jgi:hypothetical protein
MVTVGYEFLGRVVCDCSGAGELAPFPLSDQSRFPLAWGATSPIVSNCSKPADLRTICSGRPLDQCIGRNFFLRDGDDECGGRTERELE